MTRSRLGRFLHLERARPERAPDAEAPPASAGRFDAVRRPPAAGGPPAPRTGAVLDRFGPEPEPTLELVAVDGGQLPFQRCMRCGMDANVFATACAGCGLGFDTAEQRTFNERLHAQRAAQAAHEAAATAAREELRRRAEAEDGAARRELYEALARDVGDAERRRLDRELGGFGGGPFLRSLLRLLGPWW